jgi:hypothetical protein
MGQVPGSGQARFTGYDVLDQQRTWDRTTTAVVLGRLDPPPPVRFFAAGEEATARALLDRLLAQDDEPRVPVLEVIDQRLAERVGDGYRYEDMPEDPEAWRISLAGLDDDARKEHDQQFHQLDRETQLDLIENVRLCEELWHGLPPKRVFSLWTRYACDAFYAHPWAWNEVGFGGPAYPRGYKNLGLDRREPWERPESDAADPVPWVERVEAARRRHVRSRSGDGPGEPEDRS